MIKISFIVIGQNEGWKLELSLKSVFDAIILNHIKNISEVIYVDSNSDDNSIEIANKFPLNKIIKITKGYYNAAIARNLGASYSAGEYLIFLDGDMELESSFILEIFDENFNLQYDFISGNVLEYFYDKGWVFEKKAFRTMNGKALMIDKYEFTVGGFFCIKHTLWHQLNGMDICFTICEDLDFGLRMAKKNTPLLRKKDIAVIHHTISRVNSFKVLKNHLTLYYKYYGLLYRKNILNIYILNKIVKSEFTLITLIIFSFLYMYIDIPWILLLYPALVLFRVAYRSRNRIFSVLDIVNIILRDITVFFSFLFFFPKKNKYKFHYSINVKKYNKII